jgi:hypothetical protein
MAHKVHTIDLNAVEFLEGMTDIKSAATRCVYVMVCLLIYARRGPITNDAEWINTAADLRYTTDCRRHIEALLAKGKLTLTPDGCLTNPRCEQELAKARHRIKGLSTGRAPGEHRESNARATREDAVPANSNGLDYVHEGTTTTTTQNHTVTTTESLSPPPHTARARDGGDRGGGDVKDRRHEGMNGWQPSPALIAQVRAKRPDLTESMIARRTTEWRDYAGENGAPRNLAASWRGFLLKTPKSQRSRGFQI